MNLLKIFINILLIALSFIILGLCANIGYKLATNQSIFPLVKWNEKETVVDNEKPISITSKTENKNDNSSPLKTKKDDINFQDEFIRLLNEGLTENFEKAYIKNNILYLSCKNTETKNKNCQDCLFNKNYKMSLGEDERRVCLSFCDAEIDFKKTVLVTPKSIGSLEYVFNTRKFMNPELRNKDVNLCFVSPYDMIYPTKPSIIESKFNSRMPTKLVEVCFSFKPYLVNKTMQAYLVHQFNLLGKNELGELYLNTNIIRKGVEHQDKYSYEFLPVIEEQYFSK